MIQASQLQNRYNALYTQLRNYVWPIRIVETIADLELSVYQRFPDVSEISSILSKLKYEVHRYVQDDEKLDKNFDLFEEILSSTVTIYAKLDVLDGGVQ